MHVVVFTGGEAPLPEDSAPFFKNMPDVDLVIAADSGLDTAERYISHFRDKIDFTPDRIIGDMDSLRDKSLLEKYAGAGTQVLERDKDFTDTELALNLALNLCGERKNALITLVGGNGGRADHFLGIYETFSFDFHADFWLCGPQVVCYLEEGRSLELSGLEQEDCLSIARVAGGFSEGYVESEGLEWGSSVMRKKGMPSISNRISQDFYKLGKPVRLSAREGRFLVFVPINSKVRLFSTCPLKGTQRHIRKEK